MTRIRRINTDQIRDYPLHLCHPCAIPLQSNASLKNRAGAGRSGSVGVRANGSNKIVVFRFGDCEGENGAFSWF